jgi:fused signal recognition particle receptor
VAFRFFKKIGQSLSQGAKTLLGRMGSMLDGNKLSTESVEKLEESLYRADFGRPTVEHILERIREAVRNNSPPDIGEIAREILRGELEGSEGKFSLTQPPEVITLLGINGCGKTTTAAKLAVHFSQLGHSPLLGACDTFRAAANEQIHNWATQLNLDLVQSQHGADAAAVAFDALSAAIARGKDLLILDTAGRLHTKANLLEELVKLNRVLLKRLPSVFIHRWLVIDGSLGTNSLEQARQFHGAVPLTGLVITKLDGSSRGGALVSIYRELRVSIYFVGMGESPDALSPFFVENYLQSLFSSHPQNS